MIEEPPLLTIAAGIERPERALVEQFRDAPTSFVVDAMGGAGALDWRIKPIVGKSLLGVALTCDCGPGDNLALNAAIAQSQPGDVLVVAAGAFAGAAVVGDLLLGIARNRGVVGFVTDGLVRDIVDLEQVGLPVYAMGVSPNSPGKRGPGTVALPIVCGGRRIESGDIIVGDRDGIAVVTRAKIADTLAGLERVKIAEAAMLERVRGGLKDVPFVEGLLTGARVRRVDR
jgi:4-hydroxy-4-methyl-2-oxoglutarate aldolase